MRLDPNKSGRIEILDGFRCIAILSVVLYHFYCRWTSPIYTGNIYPYASDYNYFNLGYLGVQFFFIISGFVIAATLQTTQTFGSFLRKRWIRLFPALLICSLITFIVIRLFDSDNLFSRSKSSLNLVYSITLLHPELINLLLKPFQIHGSTICGSYWSLWPEVQFYFLAATLYYINPSRFLLRFFVIAIGVYLLNTFMFNVPGSNLLSISVTHPIVTTYIKVANIFNIFHYSLWFLAGVLFYQLYTPSKNKYILPGLGLIFVFLIYDCFDLNMRLIVFCMFLLFMFFVYLPQYLAFFKFKLFSGIGLVSYSLYLIHENIGVLFIHKYAAYLRNYQGLFPLILIFLFTVFSTIFYKWLEKPITGYLKKKLL